MFTVGIFEQADKHRFAGYSLRYNDFRTALKECRRLKLENRRCCLEDSNGNAIISYDDTYEDTFLVG